MKYGFVIFWMFGRDGVCALLSQLLSIGTASSGALLFFTALKIMHGAQQGLHMTIGSGYCGIYGFRNILHVAFVDSAHADASSFQQIYMEFFN